MEKKDIKGIIVLAELSNGNMYNVVLDETQEDLILSFCFKENKDGKHSIKMLNRPLIAVEKNTKNKTR